MKKRVLFKRIVLGIIIALVLLIGGAFAAFKIYTSNYYVTDDTAIADLAKDLSDEVHAFEGENGMVFLPQNQDYRAIIVFYPGGKVEYTAYSGLMYRLAQRGYVCLLPKMKDNLALLSIDVVDKLKAEREDDYASVEELDWYMAGHSLGGVAASKYVAENVIPLRDGEGPEANAANKYKGLILCASYPTDSLQGSGLRLLSIIGSNDGVIKKDGYEEGKANWPEDATEYVIQGGIHSYFGNYGIQEGDGEPEITVDKQLDQTADVIDKWISGK